MSTKHLANGSVEPPKVEGQWRLYSMEYCPYAQRSRLVLNVKKIPHDIVNINLIDKPDWYFKIHPEGKVPALDTGSQVIVESLDICDFIEEKHPQPALYPQNAETKQKDKELIKKIDPITSVFYKCLISTDSKSPEEWIKEFAPHLEPFEKELAARGTVFFGGDKPGMLDYMLWPWGERAGTIAIKMGQRLPLADDQFPALRKWRKAMREDPICADIYHGPEKFWKVVEAKIKNLPPNYDNL